LSPAISGRHGVTMLSDSPGLRTLRLRSHFIVASQWDDNPTLAVHAIAPASRPAMKLRPWYVVTTNHTFSKIFELWWLDKFHVEIDFMWLWR